MITPPQPLGEHGTHVSTYRRSLPQLEADVFLSDGGIGTSLLFDQGVDLPHFAAFTLLATAAGREALDRYFDAYARIGSRDGVGVVLGTATWRANADWGARLGYDADALAAVNRPLSSSSSASGSGTRRRHRRS